ncbi:MAG: DNA recombination protein RmuC [Sulfuricaulis sp.]|uniref:DNA recombination protein RmuC n=1 Tax=Sulfuricaulis sp. TaxID=2003553 RepID=UPI0025ED9715|nr:DNA recombination protein RmuC [Sulfuricaulis sp.]MCR4348063.1 DNA recombination protein RmuC [Sulfuricaulis sp.]
MSNAVTLIIVSIVILLAGALGWFVSRLRNQKQLTELAITLELERKAAQEKLAGLEQTFIALSNRALKENNQTFLQLAQESLKQFHVQAKGDLELKEKAVENLIKPVREALEKTEQQIRMMENDRKEAYGSLTKHLETMVQTQQLLQGETRNLVQALRRPEVRGQWGEMTLKRLAELAGMVEHCDFYEQEHTDTDEGRLRPDMIVRMPDGREIVVDVKTPLDAYLSAVEATDDDTRRKHLEHHARKVRERVRELSSKAYWTQFKNAPDFVILFIPGDQFLGAALDIDRSLLEDALKQKVILTTPTSFVALLRAVAYGWRQESLTANAAHIRDVGEELYSRLATFSEHLLKLGRSLNSTVADYNKTVGSFEAKLLPGARKFSEMGVGGDKALEEPERIEKAVRDVQEV